MKRIPWIIVVLASFGFLLSTYSFAHKESFVSGAFCTINATFNCDVVNKGPYSDIAGIPVALIGMAGYGLLIASAILFARNPTDKGHAVFLALAAAGGLGFSAYLTSVEAFILKTWCIVCLTSQIAILTIFVLSIILLINYDAYVRAHGPSVAE